MSHQPAVRFFAPEHPQTPRTLRGKLEKLMAEKTGMLAEGSASGFADYKLRIGEIRGLNEAIEICREAEKDMET